ncbi:MAG: aminoacyl-tRNA deacylase [Chloroflexi bacterium]|nr:MAG: aminoacyl-tRNA deacylase [Chloroflexota bacterium]
MAKKLNSMRILEQHKIPYEVFEYPDSIKDAEEVAEVLGVPYFTVFKTLVVQAVDRPDIKNPYLAIIPSEKQLDLKKMAATAGVKKVRMASQKDAERLTGLQVGGISALALLQKQWDVYLDQSATQLQQIIISAGQRGTQLRVPVIPLLRVIRAKIADISTE